MFCPSIHQLEDKSENVLFTKQLQSKFNFLSDRTYTRRVENAFYEGRLKADNSQQAERKICENNLFVNPQSYKYYI